MLQVLLTGSWLRGALVSWSQSGDLEASLTASFRELQREYDSYQTLFGQIQSYEELQKRSANMKAEEKDKLAALEKVREAHRAATTELSSINKQLERNKEMDVLVKANFEYRARSKALVEHNRIVSVRPHANLCTTDVGVVASPLIAAVPLILLCAHCLCSD